MVIKYDDAGFNSLRPRRNEQYFADDIFKHIFFNENVWISIKISLKFVLKGTINNIPALVQIMACHRPGDKPLYEPKMVRLSTHICVTRPQWVKHSLVKQSDTYMCSFSTWLLFHYLYISMMTWRSSFTVYKETRLCLLYITVQHN